jgi:hypothetical protein
MSKPPVPKGWPPTDRRSRANQIFSLTADLIAHRHGLQAVAGVTVRQGVRAA